MSEQDNKKEAPAETAPIQPQEPKSIPMDKILDRAKSIGIGPFKRRIKPTPQP